jgi:hypothetical protein
MVRRTVASNGDAPKEEARAARAVDFFHASLAAGDEKAIFQEPLSELLQASGEPLDLRQELGAIRVAMRRVLNEIEDPDKMALAVSRLANAAATTVKTIEAVGTSAMKPAEPLSPEMQFWMKIYRETLLRANTKAPSNLTRWFNGEDPEPRWDDVEQ